MSTLVYILPLFGVVGLIYMAILQSWVVKQDAGNDKMRFISDSIADGAMAFLKAEYRVLSIFVVIASILLAILGTQVNIVTRLSPQPLLLVPCSPF
jgi:K(+)-stimulated pyrophosphate-energized sodium pump